MSEIKAGDGARLLVLAGTDEGEAQGEFHEGVAIGLEVRVEALHPAWVGGGGKNGQNAETLGQALEGRCREAGLVQHQGAQLRAVLGHHLQPVLRYPRRPRGDQVESVSKFHFN